MKVLQVRAMEGANFFSYQPVIRGVVDISACLGKTTKEWGDFNDRLLHILPGLANHTCSRGKPGGFLERLEEGTLPGHVLEHVAIELLTLAGEKTRYGKTRLLDETRNEYEVVYQYECKEAGIQAFYLAAEVLNQLRQLFTPDIYSMVEKLKSIRLNHMPGPSTQAILDACKKRGIPVQKLGDGSLYQLGYGRFLRKIRAAMSDHTSCIGVDIAGDKQLTRKILFEAGIPVPYGIVIGSEGELLAAFREWGQISCVVKPRQGNQGKGVSIGLNNESDLLKAFHLAQVYDSQVILEEYVPGDNYRLLVIGNKMIAAAKRVPPTVLGDGRSTIKELVEKENKNPWRGEGHENYLTKISLDSVAIMDLYRQGFKLSDIPERDQKIQIRQSVNLSTGSTAIDVTDIVHPDNADLAVYAAKVLGLDIAGVDIIIKDIRKSYREQEGKIIEVNASPGLRMHLKPSYGTERDVGQELVKLLFPHGNGRIPIVSVTGTNGKTTTVRLISKILQKQKLIVGMTSTEGIFINDKMLVQGDLSGPNSAKVVLRHQDVQVAVLETARGGILRAGLGYDYADVAVITNISEDHLGQYGIEDIDDLTKVKSLVAEVVKEHSYVVLNADDPKVVALAGKTKGRVILFSVKPQNKHISTHLSLGGSAVIADRGKIYILSGANSYFVSHLSKIPLTWGGKARHNVQNVLAAVAACWALGYKPSTIGKALLGFGQNYNDNLGRLEYYESKGIKIILDYGHNPAGLREVVKTLKQIKHRRIIACIGLPGDRSDQIVRNYAREAAKGFDFLYIKEDRDLRGRKPGEIANLLAEEALAQGFKSEFIKIVLDEKEAFRQALLNAQEGDIVVIFYEHAQPLREIINQMKSENSSQQFSHQDSNVWNISLEV
ncbi:MAG: cyanophycin synthetase [Peptococcaceae bacterium]|nr:cyanophycin synthetase [Peptococcaceae bacterium]